MNRAKFLLIMAFSLISGLVWKSTWSQQFWWQSEYKDLIQAIDKGKKAYLSTSYRVGPRRQQKVELLLYKRLNGSFILELELPKRAMVSLDPKTGKTIPSKVNPIITIRDHNLDGKPDDYLIEPQEKFIYSGKSELTEDGFAIIRNAPEDQPILIQWSVGIGYCINHFLHGVDSATPRSQGESRKHPGFTNENFSKLKPQMFRHEMVTMLAEK